MLHQSMEVLRLFSPERTELGVTEAAALLDRPKSSVSRLMTRMAEAGYLDRGSDQGRYRVSMRLAALGELARMGTSLQQVARGVLEELTHLTGETSNLVVKDRDAAVNVEGVASSRPIRHVGILGRRLPFHATAAGKALLAWLDPAELDRILSLERRRWTDLTITGEREFREELQGVRERGWATAWGEMEVDLAAAAAPVRNHRGEVIAAVVLSVPTSRATPASLDDQARQVSAAALRVSRGLGWHGSAPGE